MYCFQPGPCDQFISVTEKGLGARQQGTYSHLQVRAFKKKQKRKETRENKTEIRLHKLPHRAFDLTLETPDYNCCDSFLVLMFSESCWDHNFGRCIRITDPGRHLGRSRPPSKTLRCTTTSFSSFLQSQNKENEIS